MKEIDLLPKWYKSSKKQQLGYRTQYIAVGIVFLLMVFWNFTASRSVSKAQAQVARGQTGVIEAEKFSRQLQAIMAEADELAQRASLLEKVDSRVDVYCVLGELSFLFGEKIALSKLELKSEQLKDNEQSSRASRGVRKASRRGGAAPLGDIRFKLVISGIAAEPSDVAELICKLEDSQYFCQVYPSFSKNAEVKGKQRSGAKSYKVNEFQINCYLANYVESVGN